MTDANSYPEPIPLISNCSNAFGPFPVHDRYSGNKPKSIFNLSPIYSNGERKLIAAVNVGFGTTGSHGVAATDEKRFGKGCHNNTCGKNKLVAHYRKLWDCIAIQAQDAICETAGWMATMKELLVEFVQLGVMHVSDVPFGQLFSEVRNLVPDALIQHSLRDPLVWSVRRIEARAGDIICKVGHKVIKRLLLQLNPNSHSHHLALFNI